MSWWGWLLVVCVLLLLFRMWKLATSPVVFLDTETTGTGARDEVVEIAIIDAEGKVLINTLVRPKNRKRWPDAEAIHGIGPAQVVDAPTLDLLMPSITTAVRGKNVVIYNSDFDSKFLPEALEKAAAVHCCMLRYAKYKGDWNEYRNDYRWHKLTAATRHIGYRFEGNAHRALADCRATRAVWQHMDTENA